NTDNGEESAVISVDVIESQSAEAGTIENRTVSETSGVIFLDSTILSDDATQGGDFTADEGVLNADGNFDPSVGPGVYQITYSVDNSIPCVTGQDSVTFSITVTEETQETPVYNIQLCSADINNPDLQGFRNYFQAQVTTKARLPLGGTFNPTIAELHSQYQADPFGVFTTTYTVNTDNGEESAVISVDVIESQSAEAGTVADVTLQCGADLFVLNETLLSENAVRGGTFTAEAGVLDSNGNFNPFIGPGEYVITYTVDSSVLCVEGKDSTSFTITVTEDPAEQTPIHVDICIIEINNPTVTGFTNFYKNLINSNTNFPTGGTFNPSMEELVSNYNENPLATFTSVYSVSTACGEATVEVSVTVLESPNAGQSTTVNLEEGTTETVDLFAELGENAETGGTWTFGGEEVDGTFDPATDEEGVYTYTVTSENGCSASATVTVIIGTQEPNCPEVNETEQTFCGGAPTVADLVPTGVQWYASADGTTPLTDDTALTDGTVYFAGPVEGTCDDRPSVTVTLSDNPDAPTVADFTDCVVTGATVADFDITGEDGATFTVYADEALETPVTETTVLEEGTYYVTQTNAAGCVSEAAMINVTLNDADTPTISADGNVFCEFDGATIADLQENVSGTGTITWYTTATGTQTVPQNTVLQNNTTYYAASTDATTGCESSQRLPVTVTLEVCEIVIPDAFSPNGDAINDRFEVMNLTSEYPNHQMEIYNRWGEPVFKGQAGEGQGWDGTSSEGSFGSGVLPAGVYFYILYFNDGQTAPTQGRVYLSR
ncbi:gliding motility-associated C-terminal domain-containing protein, partial [Salinimicrobium sp. HB62]|uniref:gliding motility-associated C-terminal domain-containing protein n=1 Tax=Salinimicrobium sp. HB62 TaxID=3077781 RepID=UPI002D780937